MDPQKAPPPFILSLNEISKSLGGLKIVSSNINSCNLSRSQNTTNITKLDRKIAFILKKSPDICLLQDIRVSNKSSVLEKKLMNCPKGQYISYINSTKDARGVAILLKRGLNFKIHNTYNYQCENAIFLDLTINQTRLTICSAYGPKICDDQEFFQKVFATIKSIGNRLFFVAGDLNTTTSSLNPNHPHNCNPDLQNTYSVPNKKNALFLEQLIKDQII